MSLTVGRISYANTVPFFHYLARTGFTEQVIDGVPAELNGRLATGSIDLSPSSSFEYARDWKNYLLLPGLSISSRGPVRSVLLFSRLPLDEVASERIALTGESATSVNLLQVLLREFVGAPAVDCMVPAVPVEEIINDGGSALLIGDRALRMAGTVPAGMRIYDLGDLWYRFTGLPFVFALWIVRLRAFAEQPQAVRRFRAQLERSLAHAYADLEAMAVDVAADSPLSTTELIRYWRDNMSYNLSDDHLRGLRLFFSLCFKYGLLAEEPELRFAD